MESNPRSGFSSITEKREKMFSSTFVTFFIDSKVTICIIKLEDRFFHAAMAMAQSKGFQK